MAVCKFSNYLIRFVKNERAVYGKDRKIIQ